MLRKGKKKRVVDVELSQVRTNVKEDLSGPFILLIPVLLNLMKSSVHEMRSSAIGLLFMSQ